MTLLVTGCVACLATTSAQVTHGDNTGRPSGLVNSWNLFGFSNKNHNIQSSVSAQVTVGRKKECPQSNVKVLASFETHLYRVCPADSLCGSSFLVIYRCWEKFLQSAHSDRDWILSQSNAHGHEALATVTRRNTQTPNPRRGKRQGRVDGRHGQVRVRNRAPRVYDSE